ncbi:MAG: hypothetical protein JW702_07720 [Clostridiales bacterium]|nr:hypothetical protein [Clostridiales bacterium]
MKFINIPLIYVKELKKEEQLARVLPEIIYESKENFLLNLKNGYREMAAFNQEYSEIGLREDFDNLIIYEKGIIQVYHDED